MRATRATRSKQGPSTAQQSPPHRISNFDAEAAIDGRRRNDDYALGILVLRLCAWQQFFFMHERLFLIKKGALGLK